MTLMRCTMESNLIWNRLLPQKLEGIRVETAMPMLITSSFEEGKGNQSYERDSYFVKRMLQLICNNRGGELPKRKEKENELSDRYRHIQPPVPSPELPWPLSSCKTFEVEEQLSYLRATETERVRSLEVQYGRSSAQCQKHLDQRHNIVHLTINTKIHISNIDHTCYHICSSNSDNSSVHKIMDTSSINHSASAPQALSDTPLDAPPRTARVVGRIA